MTIYHRLSVNLNKECSDFLRAYMESKGVSATETIRRALGVMEILEKGREEGGRILIEDEDGKLSKIVFMY